MRVLTYNIWDGGINPTGGDRQERILTALKEAKPDILALQEMNNFSKGELEDWGSILGMNGVLGEASTGYHLALFVRPPLKITRHAVIHPEAFMHACLSATVPSPLGELRIFVVHLNPFDPEGRLSEARYVARNADPDQTVLLLGDFNAFSPGDTIDESVYGLSPRVLARHISAEGLEIGSKPAFDTRAIQLLQWAGFRDVFRKLHPGAPGWTMPTKTGRPKDSAHMRLDYMFVTEALASHAKTCEVLRAPASDYGSDHYPLLAEFGS